MKYALLLALCLAIATPVWGQSGLEEPICLTAAVIWCNNFEDYAPGFLTETNAGGTQVNYKMQPGGLFVGTGATTDYEIISSTNEPAGVFSGTRAVKWNYPRQDGTPGFPFGTGITFMNPTLGGLRREVYFRVYHKWSANFVFSSVDNKGFELAHSIRQPLTGGGGNEPQGLQTWYFLWTHNGSDMMTFNQNHAVDADTSYGGPFAANVNGGAFGVPVLNQWYCFEFRVRQSSALDVPDGAMEMWVGVPPTFTPVLRFQRLNIVTNASPHAPGFAGSPLRVNNNVGGDWHTDFLFGGFWNQNQTNTLSHPAMNRWADNFVVSTARIGCAIAGTPPAAPSGLRFALIIGTSALGVGLLWRSRRRRV